MKNYTSLEQSKKLLELGLSPESADMWYNYHRDEWDKVKITSTIPSFLMASLDDIPCWSVGALIELLPPHVIDNKGTRYVRFSDFDHIEYLAGYSDGGFLYKAFSEWTFDQELIDVLYKCIVWLLENNYIKKGE